MKTIIIEMIKDNEPTDVQIKIIDGNQFLLKVNDGLFDGFICDADGQRVHAFISYAGKRSSINKYGLKAIQTIKLKN